MLSSESFGHDESPLRVRHFVDGRSVLEPSRRVYVLAGQAVDHGRHGVPIAAPDEVAKLVGRCSDGLARWMATGVERRRQILKRCSAALRDRVFELAEAYADDTEASAVDTAAMTVKIIDTMLATVEAAPPSPLRPGIYVYVPSARYAGARFVPLSWPLLLGGSTLILHPRLDRPRIGYAYATLLSDVGLPDGVMNLVYGDHDTTVALLGDPSVAGVIGVGPQDHATALTEAADAFGKRRLTALLSETAGGADPGPGAAPPSPWSILSR